MKEQRPEVAGGFLASQEGQEIQKQVTLKLQQALSMNAKAPPSARAQTQAILTNIVQVADGVAKGDIQGALGLLARAQAQVKVAAALNRRASRRPPEAQPSALSNKLLALRPRTAAKPPPTREERLMGALQGRTPRTEAERLMNAALGIHGGVKRVESPAPEDDLKPTGPGELDRKQGLASLQQAMKNSKK